MLDGETVSAMGDDELKAALSLLSRERERREKARARFVKSELSKANKRDPRCPECKAALSRDGRRADGVRRYECPACGRHFSDASGTSLSASKLTPEAIRKAVTMIMLDCPMWVVAWVLGINQKTAQFWRDRCLDAAWEWSMASRLSAHVWIDEMRFASPTFASPMVYKQ